MRNSTTNEKRSEHTRTTVMLIAVVLCFVISEFPQGVLVVVASIKTNIFNDVYAYLADFLDDVVLLNSSVNFILYTAMSNKFRETFYAELIKPLVKRTKLDALKQRRANKGPPVTVYEEAYEAYEEAEGRAAQVLMSTHDTGE